ncbi:hypothetical protein EDM56_24310 [Brevibacillus fluminis]|uniref:Uncharacterized protein n=2 Tax=Brevibacillus fluminis TaxID=511487 RepID=A0A3M8D1T4_9BACL|nr:hypothetical protein EDM56_24310 [Brevibacillus fluminis]
MFIADVNVNESISGRANVFNIYSRDGEVVKTENGYPYIDETEIYEWTTIFGGNPGFMKSENGLFASTIIGGTSYNFTPYKAYLLSRIASMSGGKGEPITYKLKPGADPKTKDRDEEVYYAQLNFKTSPRPQGGIDIGPKTSVNVGEAVPISFWTEDYSYYDRGIKVLSYYIYNLDTGKVEVEFRDQEKEYNDPRGDGANYGGTASPYKLAINGQSFTPTKPGRYEARVLITDLHARNSQNAPAVDGMGVPYAKPFTVGGGICTPIQSTIKISGQSDQLLTSGGSYKLPQGKNTINSLTFPVSGTLQIDGKTIGTGTTFSSILIDSDRTVTFTPSDSTKCEWSFRFLKADPVSTECSDCKGVLAVQTYTASGKGELNAMIPSGGTQFVASDADYLRIETTIPGKWYDGSGNIIPMSANVKPTSFTDGSFYHSSFTIKFVSDDGSYCWCKTFERKGAEGSVSCPTVYREGYGTVDNGGTITDIPLGGSLKLSATYVDANRDKQSANLYWLIKKPDGTTVKQVWTSNDKGSWGLFPSSFLNLPITNGYAPSDQIIQFDKKGTYTISYSYEGLAGEPYDSWRAKNCVWSITVTIIDSQNTVCSDFSYDVELDGQKVMLTGAGTQSSPYVLKVPKGEPNEAIFRLLYKGKPQQAEGYFEINSTYGKQGAWDTAFSYDFGPNKANVPEFTLFAFPRDKEDCKTYFKIIWGEPNPFVCSDVYVTASVNGAETPLTGTGAPADPYKMELLLNKDYNVDFRALLHKNGAGTTNGIESVTWELTNGKGTTFVGTGTTYTRAFKEISAGTYSLKVRVKGKGQLEPCPDKHLIIEFRSLTCKDLFIQYKFSTDSRWSVDTGSDITTSPGKIHPILIDANTGIKLVVTSDSQTPSVQNQLKVTWTVTDTKTGKTITNDSASPTVFFEKTKLVETSYLVKVKVTDAANPAFTGCELYISFDLTSKNSTCDAFFIHVYAFANKDQTIDQAQSFHNYNGKTIKLDKSAAMYLIAISKSPIDIDDGYSDSINVDWTVPVPWVDSPLFDDKEVNWTVFQKSPVPEGKYKIIGKLNDKNFTAKCDFEVTIVVGELKDPEEPTPCTTCNPGGGVEGGSMKIKVYDSSNRLLVSTADGVWEREPARIDVEIDQNKLDTAFAKVDSEIKKAIDDKKAELLAKYADSVYEKVKVTPKPESWVSKTNAKTVWPTSIPLTVTGPGINKQFLLSPKVEKQSNMYEGTVTPTLTTWNQMLNSADYVVKVDPFAIDVPYQVDFAVTYEKCEEIDDPNWVPDPEQPVEKAPTIKKCMPGTDSASISNQFTITVLGDQTSFEVYEPNATGSLGHTAEWTEYHARDRYANNQANDFYAGERILAKIELLPKHMHPFSKQYPKINAAQAWILETGKRNTTLQSNINLLAFSPILWKGAQQTIAKLGARETGVDTPLMGDKQKGFEKGGSYAVYFHIQFAYQVEKGFAFGNKVGMSGHEQTDYKSVFRIIANAWERQGIRNHTKQ